MKQFILFPNCTRSVWVTAKGERISISKMGDEHLQNTIMLMRRRIGFLKTYVIEYFKPSPKEMMKLIDMPEEKFLAKYVRAYSTLIAEAHKRGFKRNVTVEVPF